MEPNQIAAFQEIFAQLCLNAERIANALEAQPKAAPDFVKPISEYPQFPWASINAEVIARDTHGATAVSHGGKIYLRRNPLNKFGVAIWYSRATGKDENETTYERLITFKEVKLEVDPLNDKTVRLLREIQGRS